jgi:heme/copper-type cytochrome/quinol oxidase subunit 2
MCEINEQVSDRSISVPGANNRLLRIIMIIIIIIIILIIIIIAIIIIGFIHNRNT